MVRTNGDFHGPTNPPDTTPPLPQPVVNLRVIKGQDTGKTLRGDMDHIRIGRAPINEFRLGDPSVSGKHGELIRQADGFLYRDLGSSHGSLVMNPTWANCVGEIPWPPPPQAPPVSSSAMRRS